MKQPKKKKVREAGSPFKIFDIWRNERVKKNVEFKKTRMKLFDTLGKFGKIGFFLLQYLNFTLCFFSPKTILKYIKGRYRSPCPRASNSGPVRGMLYKRNRYVPT